MFITSEEAKQGCKKAVKANKQTFVVSIPAKTRNKKRLRLNGKGKYGGDVFVSVHVKKERFSQNIKSKKQKPESYIHIAKANSKASQQGKAKSYSNSIPDSVLEKENILIPSIKDFFLSFNTNEKILFKDRINGAIKLTVACLVILIILYLFDRNSEITTILKNIWLYINFLGWIGIGFITGNRKWRVLITSVIGCIVPIFYFRSEIGLNFELFNIMTGSLPYMLLTLGIIIMKFED